MHLLWAVWWPCLATLQQKGIDQNSNNKRSRKKREMSTGESQLKSNVVFNWCGSGHGMGWAEKGPRLTIYSTLWEYTLRWSCVCIHHWPDFLGIWPVNWKLLGHRCRLICRIIWLFVTFIIFAPSHLNGIVQRTCSSVGRVCHGFRLIRVYFSIPSNLVWWCVHIVVFQNIWFATVLH